MRTVIGFLALALALPLAAADTSELDVLRTVLESQERGVRVLPKRFILVAASTSPYDVSSSKLASDVKTDFTARNATPLTIAEIPGTMQPVRIADLAKLRANAGYDWQQVAAAYPDADYVVEFSRPGFTANGSGAAVRVTMTRPTGAKTFLYELSKKDGTWSVDRIAGPF